MRHFPSFHRLILTGSIALLPLLGVHAGETAAKAVAPPEKKEVSPLSFADGAVVFDVEERVRFEVRDNNRDFNSQFNDPNDDSWVLNRFRLGVALQPTRWIKIYGQFQDSREWDSDRVNVPNVGGTEGGDSDLRQAYVQFANFKDFPLGLTVGRQRLHYGDGRLVADSRWGNFGLTFDAVTLRYEQKNFWIDAFAASPVVFKEEVINDSDSADHLYGLYGSTEALGFQTTDLYLFYRDKEDHQPDLDPTNKLDPRGGWNGPPQRIATLGTRWQSKKGGLNGWDYRAEFIYQFGEVWDVDKTGPRLEHHAFAAHASGGYTWESAAWHPRLGLEYDYASGDHDPTDSDSQSFQNLFPSNHEKYGYIDVFALRNIHDARVQFTVDVTKEIQLDFNYHAFWLADTNDYWFRSPTSSLRTTTPDGRNVRTIGADNFAGHEIDFVIRYNWTKWLTLDAGYSHFFAGAYLADTGSSDDADFGYVQALIAF